MLGLRPQRDRWREAHCERGEANHALLAPGEGACPGGVAPSLRIIPEECMRKVDGCVAPRKRVWADLQVHLGEEIKRCRF